MIIDTKHGRMNIRHSQDYISKQLMAHGEYEWYVIEIIKTLCARHSTGSILDIGANQGTVCLPLSKMFPDYTIHAFEVQPHLVEIIKENIELNQCKNIVLQNYGVSNEAGTIKITVPDYKSADNIGAFSLDPFVNQHSPISVGTGSNVTVTTTVIDSISSLGHIRCIKLDIEGFELRALQGALQTLKQNNYPPIVYELWGYNAWWNNHAEKLRDFLTILGYKIQKIDDTAIAIHEKLSS
jgi:FkbM family methyltransferase